MYAYEVTGPCSTARTKRIEKVVEKRVSGKKIQKEREREREKEDKCEGGDERRWR